VSEIREKLDRLAVPMEKVEFSRENYNKLFPFGRIKTPLGMVKLGQDQFAKLIRKKRRHLLGAMRQTLVEPVVVLSEKQDERTAMLYIKSFKDDEKSAFVMSVVVNDGKDNIAISTGPRKKKQIEAKLTAGSPLYISTGGVAARLIGTDEANPATQQDILSPSSPRKSSVAAPSAKH
jgi:hypothetical protein